MITVGARSADGVYNYSASHPFRKYYQTSQEESRDQQKVGNGDKDAHQPDTPGYRNSLPCARYALAAVEVHDGGFAAGGRFAVAGEDEFFGPRSRHVSVSKAAGKKRRRRIGRRLPSGAGDRIRTGDVQLGKLTFYH